MSIVVTLTVFSTRGLPPVPTHAPHIHMTFHPTPGFLLQYVAFGYSIDQRRSILTLDLLSTHRFKKEVEMQTSRRSKHPGYALVGLCITTFCS